MALSGLILFSDKVLTIELANNFGFKSTKTFIWVFTQSLSPVLLCLAGAAFRPYRISYTIPVYFYAIQMYWVFDTNLKMDDALLHVYAFGVVLGFVALIAAANRYILKAHDEHRKEIRLLESLLDLYFKADGRDVEKR